MARTLGHTVLRAAMIVLAIAVTAIAPRTAFADQRYALVIGSNPGWSQDRPLRYAENDAARLRDVLLSSSGADELSQESRALAGSVFTHHLVSGLRGAADEDGDHQVTVSEAYHYAYGRTRADTAISGAPQRPAFRYELSGQGELVLTKLAAPHFAQVTVPKGNDEKYVVLDQREWRLIAEAHAQRDRDTVVALAPGSYRGKRVLPDHLEVGSMTLAAGDRANVDKLNYESAPLSTGVLKGDPENLSPQERAEWSRGQAFGLLADGQAQAALAIFARLLNAQPGDLEAWRGRARALVRMAEANERDGGAGSARELRSPVERTARRSRCVARRRPRARPHGRGVRASRRRAQRDARARRCDQGRPVAVGRSAVRDLVSPARRDAGPRGPDRSRREGVRARHRAQPAQDQDLWRRLRSDQRQRHLQRQRRARAEADSDSADRVRLRDARHRQQHRDRANTVALEPEQQHRRPHVAREARHHAG